MASKKSTIIESIKTFEHNVEDVMSDTIHHSSFNFSPKTRSGRLMRILFKRTLPTFLSIHYKRLFVLSLLIGITGYSFHIIMDLKEQLKQIQEITKTTQVHVDTSVEHSTKNLNELVKTLNGSTFIVISRETFLNDMAERFPYISKPVATEIVDTVMSESKKYNMNPLILYSMGIVESTQRFWIEHSQCKIIVPREDGKGTKQVFAKAVGWGGVMWEQHKALLIKEGIAHNRSDLFIPSVNIKATAAIYNMYFELDKKPQAKTQEESAQLRYFGGCFKSYAERIDKQEGIVINSIIERKTNKK